MSTGAVPKKYKALDRFEVLDEIGQGAASRILHIRDPESYQHFAMKIVIRRSAEEQKFLDQAKHEFEVAQKLDHPSIMKIYDIRIIRKWFREREVRTLLEYVNGETLEQMGSPPVPLLVLVFAEVAAAVAAMHRAGVFHADLKPNNIMVSRAGQVKVIDFGLAWYRGERKGRVQGTMGYLAPEQMRDRVVTAATDIFNFGATMYRMLTGRTVSGGTAGGAAIVSTKLVIVPVHELAPHVPMALSDLVARCCESKPQKRPQSMEDVASTLQKLRAELNLTEEEIPELLRQGRGGKNSGTGKLKDKT
jgi:serine/threonine-protein kinase